MGDLLCALPARTGKGLRFLLRVANPCEKRSLKRSRIGASLCCGSIFDRRIHRVVCRWNNGDLCLCLGDR